VRRNSSEQISKKCRVYFAAKKKRRNERAYGQSRRRRSPLRRSHGYGSRGSGPARDRCRQIGGGDESPLLRRKCGGRRGGGVGPNGQRGGIESDGGGHWFVPRTSDFVGELRPRPAKRFAASLVDTGDHARPQEHSSRKSTLRRREAPHRLKNRTRCESGCLHPVPCFTSSTMVCAARRVQRLGGIEGRGLGNILQVLCFRVQHLRSRRLIPRMSLCRNNGWSD